MPRWDEAFEMATSSSAPPGWGLQMPLELHGGVLLFFFPSWGKETLLGPDPTAELLGSCEPA